MTQQRVHQLTESSINEMLTHASQLGEAKGWKKGFASALACALLGALVVLLLR